MTLYMTWISAVRLQGICLLLLDIQLVEEHLHSLVAMSIMGTKYMVVMEAFK